MREDFSGNWGEAPSPFATAAKAVAQKALDLILPPRCLSCGTVVSASAALCPSCWRGLAFVTPPYCRICGLPFSYDLGARAICGGCNQRRPDFRRARAALLYDDASKPLILAFKHGDRSESLPAFAGWLEQAGAELLAEAEVLVPIPLHRRRLFARRFNQSALMAQALAKRCGLDYEPLALERRRNDPSQGGKSRQGRARNVEGAFAVAKQRRGRLQDRRVLLIDDVMTTGATLESACRSVKRAGARRVEALTLARVVRSQT